MSDIVERLRGNGLRPYFGDSATMYDAAAEIERLREALSQVTFLDADGGWFAICMKPKFCLFAATLDEVQAMAERAKAFTALEAAKKEGK